MFAGTAAVNNNRKIILTLQARKYSTVKSRYLRYVRICFVLKFAKLFSRQLYNRVLICAAFRLFYMYMSQIDGNADLKYEFCNCTGIFSLMYNKVCVLHGVQLKRHVLEWKGEIKPVSRLSARYVCQLTSA